MKIICQTCQSKYTVSDEKVQGKTVKIKCRKCGATILVNSSGAAQQNGGGAVADPVSYATGAGGDSSGASYTVNVADGDQRTMSLAEVIDAYNTSVINAETYVWADGMTDWLPLGQVDAIVAALHAGVAASQPPAAQPSPVAPMAGPSFGSHMPSPEPTPSPMAAAAAVPRAAARRDARGARDLFGAGGFGQEAQQSVADDVATSAPLFSAGAHAQMQPMPGAPVGQRDENSVLFSLSALTAKAGGAAPVSQTTATKDDSGLIDLRALSAGAPTPAAANLVPDNAALFPLGVPQMQQQMHSPVLGLPADAAPKNRTPIFIGLGVVVALVAVVGAFLYMKGGEEPPPVAQTEATTPVATTPAPLPEPVPTATAEASASASASASAAVAAGPKGVGRPIGGPRPPVAGKDPKAGTGGGTPPAKPPAAPAGKGNCNCPPGDLMCAMKCSTK